MLEDTPVKRGVGRPKKPTAHEAAYTPKPSNAWRVRLTAAQQYAIEKMEDIVYTMVLDGANKKTCCDFWDLDWTNFNTLYGRVYSLARAELAMKVTRNQIKILGSSKMPLAQAMMGKLFADQSEGSTTQVNVEGTDNGGITFNLRPATREDFDQPSEEEQIARLDANAADSLQRNTH